MVSYRGGKKRTYVDRVVETEVLVQTVDGVDLGLVQTPCGDIQVLSKTARVVTLGDHSNVPLRSPAQQNLSRGLAMLRGGRCDDVVLEQSGRALGRAHVQLDEAERAKRGVGGDGDTLSLDKLDKLLLLEIRMVLDLESSRADASMAQEIHDQLSAEVADTDAASELLVDQRLHSLPCFLDGCFAKLDLAVGIGPSRRVALGRVDVFESDWEMDQEQVKVLNAQVCQLLARNGLDLVTVVEGVPKLGDHEELFALDQTILDGARNTLANLFFISVVYIYVRISTQKQYSVEDSPAAPSSRR